MRRVALALASVVSGCGVQTVELAPDAPEIHVAGHVPRAVLERFAGAASAREDDKRLSFIYPSQISRVPRDLPPLTFAWRSDEKAMHADASGSFFELCLRSHDRALCIYTPERAASAPLEHWLDLVEDSGGAPLRVSLRGLLGGELYVAPARELTFSAALGAARLYLQPATGDHLLHGELASGAPARTPLVLSAAERARGASYAVSRDGRRLVYAPNDAELALVSLPDFAALWRLEVQVPGKGPVSLAFDATARRIACARGGQLALIDADTGALLSAPVLSDGLRVGHPSWSPDDRHLAVTLWPAAAEAEEQALAGSSLARMAVSLDGSLGAPELLVAAQREDDTLVFPSYSPDGRWLAFERLKGKLGEGREARIWLLGSGASEPVELAYAQETLGRSERGTQYMPSWLLSEDTAWLLFASSRSVSGMAARQQRQLWMAPILEAGKTMTDPSGAALWLSLRPDELSVARALVAPQAW